MMHGAARVTYIRPPPPCCRTGHRGLQNFRSCQQTCRLCGLPVRRASRERAAGPGGSVCRSVRAPPVGPAVAGGEGRDPGGHPHLRCRAGRAPCGRSPGPGRSGVQQGRWVRPVGSHGTSVFAALGKTALTATSSRQVSPDVQDVGRTGDSAPSGPVPGYWGRRCASNSTAATATPPDPAGAPGSVPCSTASLFALSFAKAVSLWARQGWGGPQWPLPVGRDPIRAQ